jgi:alpha-beta hydrolase superfamily lysophospholipase
MTRACYLDSRAGPLFAMLEEPPPSAARRATSVLICPPIGWQDVSSYRPRRDWAQELAAAGYPTLRFDLPGAGDSSGDPRDRDRFGAWVAAIDAAVRWLRDAGGRPLLAAVGIALGAPALLQAIAGGAPVDELVLWGAGASGRAAVREQRAFAALEGARQPVGEAPVVPDGAVMAAGFLLSAELLSQLSRFDVGVLAGTVGVRRALLLERDGLSVDEALRDWLIRAGADVRTAPGDGFADMLMAEPQDARPARATLDTIGAWLADRDPDGVGIDGPPPRYESPIAACSESEIELTDGTRVRETPLSFETPAGQLFGILSEPLGSRRDICLVLLNAGAQRRIGVNRMWVELARRWAVRGVPSLRLDLEAIGDADGESGRFTDLNSFYVPEFVDHVRGVLDTLQARGLPSRFVLLGLCSGAYWALHTALDDERVVSALMLNTRVLLWDPELLSRHETERFQRSAVNVDSWRRVLTGRTPRSHLWKAAAAIVRRLLGATAPARSPLDQLRHGRVDRPDELEALLDRLRDRGQRGMLLFTAGEPVYEELERGGYLRRWDRWPNLRLQADERLRSGSGEDHTLRPLWLQQHVHSLLDEAIEVEVGDRKPPQSAERPPRVSS